MTTVALTKPTARGPNLQGETLALPTRPWLARWLRVHTRGVLLFTFGAILTMAVLGAPNLGAQLIGVTIVVTLLGLPHAAGDPLIGEASLAKRWGRLWPALFGITYLAIAAAVLGSWMVSGVVTLSLFLAFSIVHFGASDAPAGAATFLPRRAELVLRGMIPVLGPVAFHPAETALLFSWLLPDVNAVSVEGFLVAQAAWLRPALLLGWTFVVVGHALVGGLRHVETSLEITALVLLHAFAPPLVAFGIYFGLWHAVRHGLAQAAEIDRHDARVALRSFLKTAIPLTISTVAMAVAAYVLLRQQLAVDVALTRVVFIGLAALTVPHMLMPFLYRPRTEQDVVAGSAPRS